MNRRQLLFGVGVVLFGAGVVELLAPGTLPVPVAETLLTVVGGLTLLSAAVLSLLGRGERLTHADTPEVEMATPAEVPGTDLESVLDEFPGPDNIRGDGFDTRRRQLTEAAVTVLARIRGLDTGHAREQVAQGVWTDRTRAAEYLADDLPEPERELTLRRLFASETARERSHLRTVDAIAAAAGVEGRGDSQLGDGAEADGVVDTGTAGRDVDTGRHRTGHWTGVSLVVLVCVGVGLLLGQPAVLLAGAAGLGYAAYARVTQPGTVDLSVSRSLGETDPDPGEQVEVTVTVTNNGGFCPDLRLVDGVPASLPVTGGSPRYGTALRAGESVTFSYTVQAVAGRHEFGPALVVTRNLSSSVEQELLVEAGSEIQAVPSPEPLRGSVPLRHQPTRYAGERVTDTGGEGLEFRTVREYRPGDSLARIDWNRRARTGELTTLEFDRERATRVVILLDTRRSVQTGPEPEASDALERSVAGAQRLFPALLDDGHQVGIAAFGGGECYLAPDTGARHREQGRELLASDPAFQADTNHHPRPWYWIPRLRATLPEDTQLVVFSPLLDPDAARLVRRFEAYGHPTTVVSPDPTATETPSRRLMRVRRRLLVSHLRGAGIPVLDWDPSASLEELFTREVTAR
ncbi:MAG: conserved repeat domain protein [halophilic archaeon J07HX64]|jgi:Uncharacterized conserved protein (some members contain a von Willebrand factor type A (vWA) domain)|nr:MAG: conserved repeat domain protein [halophilic archaeon J07HX64]